MRMSRHRGTPGGIAGCAFQIVLAAAAAPLLAELRACMEKTLRILSPKS